MSYLSQTGDNLTLNTTKSIYLSIFMLWLDWIGFLCLNQTTHVHRLTTRGFFFFSTLIINIVYLSSSSPSPSLHKYKRRARISPPPRCVSVGTVHWRSHIRQEAAWAASLCHRLRQTPGGSFPLTKKAALLGSPLQTREALQLVRISPVRRRARQ